MDLTGTPGSSPPPAPGAAAGGFPSPPVDRDPNRVRVCVHESAHVVAGHLLGRPIGGVSVNGSSGAAAVATVRPDADPARVAEEYGHDRTQAALDDIAISLVVDYVPLAPEVRIDPNYLGEEALNGDEALALEVARSVVPDHEARALVEVGRCRAKALAEEPDFILLLDSLWPVLYEHGELSREDLNTYLNIAPL